MTRQSPSVVVYDDRPMFLQATVSCLNRHSTIGDARGAATLDAALAAARDGADVLLFWAGHANGASTSAVLREANRRSPSLRVLVVGSDVAGDIAIRVLIDVSASVLEDSASEEALVAAVRQVANGQLVLPAPLAVTALRLVSTGFVDRPAPRGVEALLTPRERDILRLVARGVRRDIIASQLGLSTNTVRSHLGNMMTKLGVHSEVELAAAARRSVARSDSTAAAV